MRLTPTLYLIPTIWTNTNKTLYLLVDNFWLFPPIALMSCFLSILLFCFFIRCTCCLLLLFFYDFRIFMFLKQHLFVGCNRQSCSLQLILKLLYLFILFPHLFVFLLYL